MAYLENTTTLYNDSLAGLEFGGRLLSMQALRDWAKGKGFEVPTPELYRYQFVQVEAFLCEIERHTASKSSPAATVAMVKTDEPYNPKTWAKTQSAAAAHIVKAALPEVPLGENAAELLHWLNAAQAHRNWRRVLGAAIQAGELTLLDYDSGLPVEMLGNATDSARHDEDKPAVVAPQPTIRRRDPLTPAIELAQRGLDNRYDPAAVWVRLQAAARAKVPPFISAEDEGLKWLDELSNARFFKIKDLRDRLRRQKERDDIAR
jgi:hypothetical protein